jgi:hypothetical protein
VKEPHFTPSGVVNGLTGICFAYAGSALFPELIQEMDRKQDFLGPTGSLALGKKKGDVLLTCLTRW